MRVISDEKVPNGNGYKNVFSSGGTSIGIICTDTQVGEYVANLTAVDGYGGKSLVGAVTITISEERVSGGEAIFSN